MAKLIQISPDGGTTWNPLPGSEGAFNVEAEAISDTILGQSYSSAEVGLVTWSVSSDGIFKGFPGYTCDILKSGAGGSAVGEACSIVGGKTYEVDDITRSVWDRSVAIVVDDGGVDHTADVESIDYLFGRVTFKDAYTVTGAVTVDVDYFTTVVIGRANSYTLTMTADQIDESDFQTVQGNNGTRVFSPGLRTVALELGGIFDATENFKTDLTDRNELIIEVRPAGDVTTIARGFFKPASAGQSGSVGALEEETVTFNLYVPDETVNPQISYPFQWRFENTILNAAIQNAITSWLGELKTYEVRYMPQGAITQSPLDAIEGAVIFTDISLSGGLSNMNVFNIEMVGAAGFTVV